MDADGEAATCWENGQMTMPAPGGRWFNPPGFLADHAPINYSAKILKSLQGEARNDAPTVTVVNRDRQQKRVRPSAPPTH
jgi:hypothetical protein